MEKVEFFNHIKETTRPVIVDFWAPWCIPCRAMEPAIHQISEQFEGRVEVLKMNADESPEVLQALGIYGIPTMIGFDNGKEIARKTGAQSNEALRVFFNAIASGQKPAGPTLTPVDRIIRAVGGLTLAILGWSILQSYILIGFGGILIFSAVYDRCPIYSALAPRVKKFFRDLNQR